MAELFEKRYSIDPGRGKKMDGCPYSTYEDGKDVKSYIIPPKGYVFSGFRFDPEARNQIYDGKLIAEYTKEPFHQKFKDNLWKFILAFVIIAVIALIVVLAAGVFKKTDNPKTPKTVVQPQDTLAEKGQTNTDEATLTINTPSTPPVQQEEVIPDSGESDKSEQVTPQPEANDLDAQFKQEFWALIHQYSFTMDSYHDLYTNYKDNVKGEEYDYLRYTILKDYVSFKAWYTNLKKIPDSQLQSIKSVDELKKKINE